MASLLDTGISNSPQVQGFPSKESDVKALFKIAMDSVHNPKVRDLLIRQIEGSPDRIPDIVSRLAAMLAWRIKAQVQEQMRVDLPPKNVIGLILVITTEIYSLLPRMGGTPADEQLVQETAHMAVKMIDQMAAGGGQQ